MRGPVASGILAGAAATVALHATPVHADIRAEYAYEGDQPPLVVEVTDDGDARISGGVGGFFLILDGDEYWIEPAVR